MQDCRRHGSLVIGTHGASMTSWTKPTPPSGPGRSRRRSTLTSDACPSGEANPSPTCPTPCRPRLNGHAYAAAMSLPPSASASSCSRPAQPPKPSEQPRVPSTPTRPPNPPTVSWPERTLPMTTPLVRDAPSSNADRCSPNLAHGRTQLRMRCLPHCSIPARSERRNQRRPNLFSSASGTGTCHGRSGFSRSSGPTGSPMILSALLILVANSRATATPCQPVTR